MTKPPSQADQRAARLAEQLRANLRKRKSQARGVATQIVDKPASD
ncbi:MAG: hypothetical protein ABL874_01100 [Sphingopyxis sp.]